MDTPVASAAAAEPEPPGMASGATDEVFGPGSEAVTSAVTGTVGSTFAGNDAAGTRSPTGVGTPGPVPEEQRSGTGRDAVGEPSGTETVRAGVAWAGCPSGSRPVNGSGVVTRVDGEPAGVAGVTAPVPAPPGAGAATLWAEPPAGPGWAVGEAVGTADDPGLPGAAGDVAEDGPPHPDGDPPAG